MFYRNVSTIVSIFQNRFWSRHFFIITHQQCKPSNNAGVVFLWCILPNYVAYIWSCISGSWSSGLMLGFQLDCGRWLIILGCLGYGMGFGFCGSFAQNWCMVWCDVHVDLPPKAHLGQVSSHGSCACFQWCQDLAPSPLGVSSWCLPLFMVISRYLVYAAMARGAWIAAKLWNISPLLIIFMR